MLGGAGLLLPEMNQSPVNATEMKRKHTCGCSPDLLLCLLQTGCDHILLDMRRAEAMKLGQLSLRSVSLILSDT